MQKISMNDLKNKLRKTFRDEQSIQWSDALLDEILFEAQREYALYSGGLAGSCEIYAADTPVLYLPEDFFEIIEILGDDGRNIPVISYRRLAEIHGDFRNDKGSKAEYCCLNFDSFGKFRIYPQLPDKTFVGTLIYKRIPLKNEWIGYNSCAIEQHALFQMYQFTGKAMAQNCYQAFLDEIYREKKTGVASGSKTVVRSGVYY